MLEETAKKVGAESIVSWQPHGKAFRVHLPDVFARTVMRRYFKQTKYKSFQRQLHIYGFHRIRKGMDRGAYFHPMFVRDTKSMSLGMSCQKIKGMKKATTNAAVYEDHRGAAAAVDPDFYSSETKVDNGQNLMKNAVLQADPVLQAYATLKEMKRGCSVRKLGRAAVFTTGSSDYQPDEENSDHLFNQEVSACSSPSHHQLIGSDIGLLVDWMEHIWDAEQASPYHGYNHSSTVSEKGHHAASSALLHGGDQKKKGDDEGVFEGKRFFYVVETNTQLLEDFSGVVKRGGGPMFYMPRSA
jgi:hypothetical protein